MFVAQGNSGGNAQIAFGLAYYGLDEVLDLANLSAILRKSPSSPAIRVCTYPRTTVRFYLEEDEPTPEIIESANAYFAAITSDKWMQILPNVGHRVHRTAEGTAAMLASIRQGPGAGTGPRP